MNIYGQNLHVYRVKIVLLIIILINFNLLQPLFIGLLSLCAKVKKNKPSDEIFIQTSPPIFYAYWAKQNCQKTWDKNHI